MRRLPTARRRATDAWSIARLSSARHAARRFRCHLIEFHAARFGHTQTVAEQENQQTTVAHLMTAALGRLDQPFHLAPGEVLARAVACPPGNAPPFFSVLPRSSFCPELSPCDAPQTRMNKGPGFWTFYKMYHFVESVTISR